MKFQLITLLSTQSPVSTQDKTQFKVDHFRWDFRTFDHDIRFGIKRVNNKTGEENIEVPLQRVASHQLDEEGFITCQKDCTCKSTKQFATKPSTFNNFFSHETDHVLFDNTYSYFKGKRIRYAVSLVKEQNVDELEAAADKITNG